MLSFLREHRHRHHRRRPAWADLRSPNTPTPSPSPVDPRTANQAIQAVYAAGLAAGADADGAAEAGLEFFKQLNEAGNFVPVDRQGRSDRAGHDADRRRLGLQCSRLARRLCRQPGGRSRRPVRRVVAGVYIQAISAYAPHPNAAKLWMEYLYSDEGQLGWLAGYCHPIRFNDLADRGVIPQELLDEAAAGRAYAKAVFPTTRRAECRQGSDHHAVGHRRRRQCPVIWSARALLT